MYTISFVTHAVSWLDWPTAHEHYKEEESMDFVYQFHLT